jgi:hypothetical protein
MYMHICMFIKIYIYIYVYLYIATYVHTNIHAPVKSIQLIHTSIHPWAYGAVGEEPRLRDHDGRAAPEVERAVHQPRDVLRLELDVAHEALEPLPSGNARTDGPSSRARAHAKCAKLERATITHARARFGPGF